MLGTSRPHNHQQVDKGIKERLVIYMKLTKDFQASGHSPEVSGQKAMAVIRDASYIKSKAERREHYVKHGVPAELIK